MSVLKVMQSVGMVALVLLLAACGTSATEETAIPGAAVAVDDPFSGGYPTYDDEATGLRIVFGTPDIAVGTSRISLALFDRDGLVSEPGIDANSHHYPGGPGGTPEAGDHALLTFRPFPDGGRGIYTGDLSFDRPGLWSLTVLVTLPDGTAEVTFPVEVAHDTVAPDVGDPAPPSENRTSSAQTGLDQLTTASRPDPRLYRATIAETLAASRPFVLTFASPAFCTNALCGPQVEVLSALADDYGDRAAFIHVDLYENPTEIRGDLSAARRTPVLDEWGIHTDEWTFVVDGDGIVRARFEGFAPRDEVEEALLAVIASPQ